MAAPGAAATSCRKPRPEVDIALALFWENLCMSVHAIRLGCIADDFTGATDLANNLVRAGMRVVQTIGVPNASLDAPCDAVVVSLKSRTIPAREAVEQSLRALKWLQDQGAEQIYFKYCSTFDSTAHGNIGPVADALMQALGTDFTIATPAFPDTGRTVFKGHLFVGDVLLSDSGMKDHPLTPMRDSNLLRVLQSQTQQKVGLIDYRIVAAGPQAVAERIETLQAEGVRVAIVDAITNDDLYRIGPAMKRLPLVTAGSGVAIALPANFGIDPSPQASALPAPAGTQAILAGSCSQATQAQVAHVIGRGGQARAVDALRLAQDGERMLEESLAWALERLSSGPVLLYSTVEPRALAEIQSSLGVQAAGDLVEQAHARIARALVQAGVGQLIVAGGETSGAVVQALGIERLQIGAQIDPGVPWCLARTPHAAQPIHIALKSGNFGSADFFSKAFGVLAS